MSAKKKKINQKMQQWIDARKRHHLSHAQVQMARELGMNPTKLGKLDNHEQEPWKMPLRHFIEPLYEQRFGKKPGGAAGSSAAGLCGNNVNRSCTELFPVMAYVDSGSNAVLTNMLRARCQQGGGSLIAQRPGGAAGSSAAGVCQYDRP